MRPDWLTTATPTIEVAQKLLGYLLVHESPQGRTSGWIVETEAYLGFPDQASHGYQGRRTPSIETLFSDLGIFYVYQRRGLKMMNLVTEEADNATGVLLRAIHPYEGRDLMVARRQKAGRLVTNGPAKITQAMGIGIDYNGASIEGNRLYIDFTHHRPPQAIVARPRVGIPNKGIWTEKPLRFYVADDPYISKK